MIEGSPESAPAEKTQPRRAREALRQSEELFSDLVAGVQDYAIFLLDETGRIATWNAGAARIKGYEAGEIIGRHFSVFYMREEVALGWPDHELEVAAKEGRFVAEGWRVRKDGSTFWASIVITAMRERDGRVRGFLKITRDLTERWRAEEALRQSEERFRLLVENVEDYAIFMLTPDGLVASWSRGAERIKGYAAADILGQHFSRFYPPEAIAQGRPEWELRAAAEHGHVEDEGWRIRKNGERFWANVVITALYSQDGTLRGFTKITRDMTSRRKMEELEKADRQKDEFLAMLAHELRNPLAPIRSALHVMAQPSATRPQVARALEIGERQVEHMARLLEDLMDVSRVNQGTLELRSQPVEVASAIKGAVEAVRPLLQQRDQLLTVETPSADLWVRADPTRLQQALMNLLINASKYTDPGGRIWVDGRRDGGEVALRVKDSGIGIEAAMLPRIFELFVQADRRLDRSVGGVGIGLTLVKKLVELQGGRVDAFSAGIGKGSEFVIRLPAIKAPFASRQETRADETPAPEAPIRLRVLVVDDNVDAASGLAQVLELSGYDVRASHDGQGALAAAESFQPHVVLLDIGLPEMDGYEVARELRRRPGSRRALLVAVTGWGHESDKKKSREAGVDHHLIKPVDPAALKQLLSDYRPPAEE